MFEDFTRRWIGGSSANNILHRCAPRGAEAVSVGGLGDGAVGMASPPEKVLLDGVRFDEMRVRQDLAQFGVLTVSGHLDQPFYVAKPPGRWQGIEGLSETHRQIKDLSLLAPNARAVGRIGGDFLPVFLSVLCFSTRSGADALVAAIGERSTTHRAG